MGNSVIQCSYSHLLLGEPVLFCGGNASIGLCLGKFVSYFDTMSILFHVNIILFYKIMLMVNSGALKRNISFLRK